MRCAPARQGFPSPRPGHHGGLPYGLGSRPPGAGRATRGLGKPVFVLPSLYYLGGGGDPRSPSRVPGAPWTRGIGPLTSPRQEVAPIVVVLGYPQGSAGLTQRPSRGSGSGEPTPVPRAPPGGNPFTRPSRGAFQCLYGTARTSSRSFPPTWTWPRGPEPRWSWTKFVNATKRRYGS